MKKAEQLPYSTLLLLISGILIFKGIPNLESLLTRIVFLFFPSNPSVSIYFGHSLDLVITGGTLWILFLIVRKKELEFLNHWNLEHFKRLGVSFLIIFVGYVLIHTLSEDYFSNKIADYVNQNELGLGFALEAHELFTSILSTIKGVSFMIIFFLAIKNNKKKPEYEWPISGKNEEIVPTSIKPGLLEPSDIKELKTDISFEETGYNEDVIYFNNHTCMLVWGNAEEGYTVTEPMEINELNQNVVDDRTDLNPSFEARQGDLIAVTGETSWGGAGFIAVKKHDTEVFEWLIHLSTMNNPIELTFERDIIQVKTDLNYPYGVLYSVPFRAPEKFTAKLLTASDSSI